MSFDNTKYHCEINSVPYQIRGYQRSELATFIPRLGAGDQRESAFDLLRSKTLEGFEGGMLQRYLDDNTSVFGSEGLYPNFEDGTLYPTNEAIPRDPNGSAPAIMGTSPSTMTAYVTTKDYVIVATKRQDTGANSLRLMLTEGSITTFTLPANISSSSRSIVSLVIFDNKLWVGVSDGLTMGYWSLTGGGSTVTEIGSGTSTECAGGQLVVYKGGLYGVDGSVSFATSAQLRKHTGGTSARTYEVVGDTGIRNHDPTAKLFKYNNRIMLSRKDGLWAYDGIQLVEIETTTTYNIHNYTHPTVYKGYLYYFMPDGMYRFNGSLIEKMYDISEIGFPTDMFVGKNRMWLIQPNTAASGSSRYNQSMGYDYSSGSNLDGLLFCFNGKGLYVYARIPTTTIPSSPAHGYQNEVLNGFYFSMNDLDQVWIMRYDEKTVGNGYYNVETAGDAYPPDEPWQLVTSIDDSEFPMIDKNLENIELILDGDVSDDETITIEYRTSGFDGSTGWTSIGSIFTQSHLKEYIWRNTPAGITYKQIQFRFSGTTALSYGIKRIIMRYTLAPDYKNQWSFTALCYGDEALAPLLLADDTEGAQTVQTLRGNLYTARNSNVPVKYIDIDCLDLNEALDASETTVTLNSTALLKGDDGFIQIDDEILYWYAKTATDLTVVRGQLGTTAATHNDNSKVFIVYRVIVRQIQNERIELDKPESTAEDKSRASEVTLVLQEV